MNVHVGFLVSYDYELLYNSIPQIYEDADRIYLAIDAKRKTWNGEEYHVDESFFSWLYTMDSSKKIEIYEDDFYVEGFSTMACEVRERRMLAERMGIGNWLLQLDADEYFIEFRRFVSFLRKHNHYLHDPRKTPINVSPFSVNLYKKVDKGYLLVDLASKQWIATNMPEYVIGRKTRNPVLYHDSIILHECLARTREELEVKLRNWGHNTDIDKNEFLAKWELVNEENYQKYRDFFYLDPERWKKLRLMDGGSIQELIETLSANDVFSPSKAKIFLKNIPTRVKYCCA